MHRLVQFLFRPLVIRDLKDGTPYLTRYHLLDLGWLKLFVHRIHREDGDRHLHNHPWTWCRSLILAGGYVELRTRPGLYYWHKAGVSKYKELTHARLSWNKITDREYHRIAHVLPGTWTLFLAGQKDRDWGFLVNDKHVVWHKYLGVPPETDLGD